MTWQIRDLNVLNTEVLVSMMSTSSARGANIETVVYPWDDVEKSAKQNRIQREQRARNRIPSPPPAPASATTPTPAPIIVVQNYYLASPPPTPTATTTPSSTSDSSSGSSSDSDNEEFVPPRRAAKDAPAHRRFASPPSKHTRLRGNNKK